MRTLLPALRRLLVRTNIANAIETTLTGNIHTNKHMQTILEQIKRDERVENPESFYPVIAFARDSRPKVSKTHFELSHWQTASPCRTNRALHACLPNAALRSGQTSEKVQR